MLLTFIARRLVLSVPVFIGASIVLFGCLYLLPGDPAVFVLGDNARPEELAAFRHSLGLDLPWYTQYLYWLGRLLTGNFGNSLVNGFPVATLLLARLPVTLELAAGSLLVTLGVGVPLGIYCGLNPTGFGARVVDFFNANAIAMPVFWLGLLLQIAVGLDLGLLPVLGYVPWDQDPIANLQSMVMPSVTLGIGSAAVIARFLAAGIDDVRTREFVLAARARGIKGARIVLKHIMRNAIIPTVTALGLHIARLMGGAVLTEAVFNLPGLGNLLWRSMQQRDYFVIQALMLFTVLVFIVMNLITDLAYGIIDPRIRAGATD